MKKQISTKKAPAAVGPYSQAIEFNNLIFTSGQIPLNPENGLMVDNDPAVQAKQVMENLKAVLEASNSSFEHVIKTTIFLANLEHFNIVNDVYSSYFNGEYPARSCVQVAKLPKDSLVEIELIAYKK